MCRFLLLLSFPVLCGCSEHVSVPARESTTSMLPRLIEGLPHPIEGDVPAREKQRPQATQFHGYWFYSPAVSIPEDRFSAIERILKADGSFKDWSGEKRCGGFHPDWLVRLRSGDGQTAYVICFGCHEVKVFADGKVNRYDLEDSAYAALSKYLKEMRVNRPG